MSQVAHHDARSLFERAWSYGREAGLIDADRRAELLTEGARAIRKIANVLGSEHLRSDLERAMRSMIGLVELHLERISGGDLSEAARSIALRGLLFHTRGASQAIKRLLAEADGNDPEALDAATQLRYERIVVTEWPGQPLSQLLELERVAARDRALREAARALAGALDAELDPHDYAHPEPILLTGLLILAYRPGKPWIEDVAGFERLLASVRRSPARLSKLPKGIPTAHRALIEEVWAAGGARITTLVAESDEPVHVLAAGATAPLRGLLWLPGDALAEVEDLDRTATAHWKKLTRGSTDPARLRVVMLQGVLGFEDRPPFSLKTAERLLRTVIVDWPEDRMIEAWLDANAPHPMHAMLKEMWDEFWDDREVMLDDDCPSEEFRAFADEWLPIRRTAKAAGE